MREEMKEQKKMMRGWSIPRLRMVGLFCLSVLIIVQIKLSPPLISIFSSSPSSSFSSSHHHLILSLSLSSNISATSTHQPPPEEAFGEIKLDPLRRQSSQTPTITTQINCDRASDRYDFCSITGPNVLDPTTATFFVTGSERSTRPNIVEKIKPSPRKFDKFLMPRVKNVTILSGPRSPPCKAQHNVPALVFSLAGYIDKNFWHAFNDGFIPLFITVHTVFPNGQDFVIVITEGPDWWAPRYADILNVFTKHSIITLKNENTTHCFPSAHIGLISHGFMEINHTLLPNSKTYMHFHDIFKEAYDNKHSQTLSLKNPPSRPRLLFATRRGVTTRAMLNKREAMRVMKEVGFDVVVFEPSKNTPLRESYALVSSSHAMIGVHGAALTHSVFLRPGSVLMQVVPIGIEWAAKAFFGRVANGIKLEYMEYKIEVEESSLAEKYGKDSLMVRDPLGLQKGGWPPELMNIYLLDQNVTLDLVRFRGFLEEGYKKAKKFMRSEGDDV